MSDNTCKYNIYYFIVNIVFPEFNVELGERTLSFPLKNAWILAENTMPRRNAPRQLFSISLIKRKPKQKIFHLLLKEKNGGQKKIKNVMKKFLFWFAVAESEGFGQKSLFT